MLPNASAEEIGQRAAAAWDKHLNDNPELKAEYVKTIRRRSEVERCIKWVLLEESMMERMIDKIEEIYNAT